MSATGVAYLNTVLPPERELALEVIVNPVSIQFWGIVFIICGLLSVLSSRWPKYSEKWGYYVLTGFSAGWAAAYLGSIIFDRSPFNNITTAFLWSLVAFLWWAISGLINPPATIIIVDRRASE